MAEELEQAKEPDITYGRRKADNRIAIQVGIVVAASLIAWFGAWVWIVDRDTQRGEIERTYAAREMSQMRDAVENLSAQVAYLSSEVSTMKAVIRYLAYRNGEAPPEFLFKENRQPPPRMRNHTRRPLNDLRFALR